jgi:hypothetical protein
MEVKMQTDLDLMHSKIKDLNESCVKALDETMERIEEMQHMDENVDFGKVYKDRQ